MRRARTLGTVVAIASIASAVALLVPAGAWMGSLVEWMRGAGALGVLVYALAFAIAAVCLVPGSILTVGAGMAYGLVAGTLIASPASALAATAAFVVGRTVARRRVARWAEKNPRIAALDAAIGDHGLKLVILIRLSPLFPFNFLNYALGLTRVRLRDYILGSFLGMLPVTVLYVYIGSLAGQLASLARGTATGGPLRHAVSALGLAATIAVTVVVTRLARRALDAAIAPRPARHGDGLSLPGTPGDRRTRTAIACVEEGIHGPDTPTLPRDLRRRARRLRGLRHAAPRSRGPFAA